MNTDLLTNLTELCARKGVNDAIICPGSRSAPLTISFTRNKKIKCRTFSDERSAAFIALGIAQQTKKPVVLICTSGSAAYNFAPAIAEAFFQQIPLIVLTADRPTEWIDQLDGQTIRQKELYGNHIKKYFELPLDYSHPDAEWYANRIVNEAINLSLIGSKGPVHINAPFREPLYPTFPTSNDSNSNNEVRIIENQIRDLSLSDKDFKSIIQYLSSTKKILVVAGQNEPDAELRENINQLNESYHWPIAGDILSNLHFISDFCGHTDTFLAQRSETEKESLQPDLLITFGKSLISKNLKLFLRKYKAKEHWHIGESDNVADTFQSLTKSIRVKPTYFFQRIINEKIIIHSFWKEYKKHWDTFETTTLKKIDTFFQIKNNGEFELVKKVIESLPANCNLHLANSMTVRYANHIGITDTKKNITVYSNRGTSGIDGCSSTAVGHALSSETLNILITGDLAFFYDRNAFWHNYQLPNLVVIVLNNHGGIIFNLIDGPAGLPEADEFFITKQNLKAKSVATEFGFSYSDGSGNLTEFFKKDSNVKILEYESSQSTNKKVFEEFKAYINQNL